MSMMLLSKMRTGYWSLDLQSRDVLKIKACLDKRMGGFRQSKSFVEKFCGKCKEMG